MRLRQILFLCCILSLFLLSPLRAQTEYCAPDDPYCDPYLGNTLEAEYGPQLHDCSTMYWHNLEDINNDGLEDGCYKGAQGANDCDHRYGPTRNPRKHCIGSKCCDSDGPILCPAGVPSNDGYAWVLCPHPTTGMQTLKIVPIQNCQADLVGAPSGLYCFNDTNQNGKIDGGETVLGKATCAEATW